MSYCSTIFGNSCSSPFLHMIQHRLPFISLVISRKSFSSSLGFLFRVEAAIPYGRSVTIASILSIFRGSESASQFIRKLLEFLKFVSAPLHILLERSHPIEFIFILLASSITLPVPQKGSSMVLSSLIIARLIIVLQSLGSRATG